MLSQGAKRYVIDLCEAPEDRWAHVIRYETSVANQLVHEAMAEIHIGATARSSFSWVFEKLYRLSGGRFAKEMAAWAKALEISSGQATVLNCSYELSHLWERLAGMRMPVLGCTAGARWLPNAGMVHVRNMDWSLPNIGNATRLFHFKDGGREFYSVGITGFVGVLSGMVPGAYSITLNWAPPVGRPTFDFGPSFLVREVLETCDSYEEAVEVLASTRLSTSVFFMVSGTKRTEACVIERRKKKAAIRRIRGGVLTQANHHVARPFRDHDDYWIGYTADRADTQKRADTLRSSLAGLSTASSLATAAKCLGAAPVLNSQTVQQMAFCPSTGEVKTWRRTSP